METIYYSLDAKRLTVYGMASGETAPQPRSFTCVRRERPAGTPGLVLDMEDYRRGLTAREGEAAVPAAPARGGRAGRARRRLGLALDLCATLAVVVMAVVAVLQFAPLL